jgi:hypothetical protein
MERITVEKIYANEKDFNGNPYKNKFTGEPEIRYTIVAGDRKFKLYGAKDKLAEVKVGDTLEGNAEKKEYEGREYYTFTLPKPKSKEEQELLDRIDSLEDRVRVLEEAMFADKKEEEDLDAIPDEDIPF